MKSYNQIIFKGIVGNSRVNQVGDRKVANFSVATEYSFKDKSGSWVVETTWLNVCAWSGSGVCDLDSLKKGVRVFGSGRLRTREYTDQQGNKRDIFEVLADNLDIILDKPKDSREQPRNTAKSQSNAGGNKSYGNDDDIPF